MTHNLLKGKRGIIFGALNEESIAWKVAVKAAEEGATIALSNTAMALRMGKGIHRGSGETRWQNRLRAPLCSYEP